MNNQPIVETKDTKEWESIVDSALASAKNLSTTGLGLALSACFKHFEKHSKSGVLLSRLIKGLIDLGLEDQAARMKTIARECFALTFRKGGDGVLRFEYKAKEYEKVADDVRDKVHYLLTDSDGLDGAYKYVAKRLADAGKKTNGKSNAPKTKEEILEGAQKSIKDKTKEMRESINYGNKQAVYNALKAVRELKSELGQIENALNEALKKLAADLSDPIAEEKAA